MSDAPGTHTPPSSPASGGGTSRITPSQGNPAVEAATHPLAEAPPALRYLAYGRPWLGLFLYNLIFILPLVLILLIASDKALLAKVQAWQQSERKSMRWGGGIAMLLLGMIVFTV